MLPKTLRADHVAGHPHAENVAQAQIENQLGRRARIDATEHHRQRVLAFRGGLNLPAKVARQPATGAKSIVSFAKNLQHLLRVWPVLAARASSNRHIEFHLADRILAENLAN